MNLEPNLYITYAEQVRYESSVPLATLGLKPGPGLKIRATSGSCAATASRPSPGLTGTRKRQPSSATFLERRLTFRHTDFGNGGCVAFTRIEVYYYEQ